MKRHKVLVMGSDGQLGSEIQYLAKSFDSIHFVFSDRKSLDIVNQKPLQIFFKDNSFDYCINCTGFTNVDRAEVEREEAYAVNLVGIKNLAENCLKYNVVLLHISTDYVFDGNTAIPYKETDTTNPINYYGKTKLEGEKEIIKTLKKFFIIRSSWLYGRKGNNFVKIIIDKVKSKAGLKIVSDQVGSPTSAKDLSRFILHLIMTNNTKYGVFHFSNKGKTSWFGFAEEILVLLQTNTTIEKISSNTFSSKAKRPKYSVLDTNKVIYETDFEIRDWKEALKEYIIDNY